MLTSRFVVALGRQRICKVRPCGGKPRIMYRLPFVGREAFMTGDDISQLADVFICTSAIMLIMGIKKGRYCLTKHTFETTCVTPPQASPNVNKLVLV